jgi:hypothetical protein
MYLQHVYPRPANLQAMPESSPGNRRPYLTDKLTDYKASPTETAHYVHVENIVQYSTSDR